VGEVRSEPPGRWLTRSVRRVARAALLLCGVWLAQTATALAAGAVPATAQSVVAAQGPTEFSETPVPRLELGTHSDEIVEIVPAGADQLLTVSYDKTARLWSARTGGLRHVWRAPDPGSGSAHDGWLYCAAVTPDSRTAVLGGYSRQHLGQSHLFSLFFLNLGNPDALMVTLDGFPAAIQHLVFSADGQKLFVALGGGFGFYVLDWPAVQRRQARVIASDTFAEGEEVLGGAFAPNGDLAVTMSRGSLRLYEAAKGYRQPTVLALGSVPRPLRPRFSPDGRWLAFGSIEAPVLGIVDVSARQLAETLRAPAADDVRGLYSVEWSADGQSLYTGGEIKHDLSGILYRVDRQRSMFAVVKRSGRRLRDLARLKDGSMAYVTAEPDMGIIEPAGRLRWVVASAAVKVRRDGSRLSSSKDGLHAQFKPNPTVPLWFNIDFTVGSGDVVRTMPAEDPELKESPRVAPGRDVVVSDDREQVTIAGVPVVLTHAERVLDWAFVADTDRVVVGTSQMIRRVAPDGSSDWLTQVVAEVDALVISGDRRWVIAALRDGTLRWYRYSNGSEVAAVLPLRSGKDWVAWIPSGYYVSSPSGDQFIGWQTNHLRPDGLIDVSFYRAAQFERVLYKPGLVHEYVLNNGLKSLRDITQRADEFEIGKLAQIAPPKAHLAVLATTRNTAQLHIEIEGASQPICSWNLFVNGIPVLSSRERSALEKPFSGPQVGGTPSGGSTDTSAKACNGKALDTTRPVEVPLSARSNYVRLELVTRQALGLAETFVDSDGPSGPASGNLYVAAIGVSHFDDGEISKLSFAARDAEAIAAALTDIARGGSFTSVHTLVLSDGSGDRPTAANIRSRLAPFFADARGEDTVVLFMASHGMSDGQGNYYFIPADAASDDLEHTDIEEKRASLVSWQDIVDQLGQAGGRRLLIVDTCEAGALAGARFNKRFDVPSLAKRSMSSNFALMAASSADEESQELPSQAHGLFTYGLLEALRTASATQGGGVLTLSQAFDYAAKVVERLRNKAIGNQTPRLIPPQELANMVLVTSNRVGQAGRSRPPYVAYVSGPGAGL